MIIRLQQQNIEIIKVLEATDKSRKRSFLEESINNGVSNIKSKYRFTKITTSTITAIMTTVFVFPATVTEHPILNKLVDINSGKFSVIWLLSLYITIIIWIISYNNENKYKKNAERFKNEHFQNQIFQEFINWHIREETFNKQDFVNYLDYTNSVNRRAYNKIFFNSMNSLINISYILDDSLKNDVADIIFEKAESRLIIEKVNNNLIMDKYKLNYNIGNAYNEKYDMSYSRY